MTTTTPVVAEVQPDKRLEKRTGRRFSASEELRQKNGKTGSGSLTGK